MSDKSFVLSPLGNSHRVIGPDIHPVCKLFTYMYYCNNIPAADLPVCLICRRGVCTIVM